MEALHAPVGSSTSIQLAEGNLCNRPMSVHDCRQGRYREQTHGEHLRNGWRESSLASPKTVRTSIVAAQGRAGARSMRSTVSHRHLSLTGCWRTR